MPPENEPALEPENGGTPPGDPGSPTGNPPEDVGEDGKTPGDKRESMIPRDRFDEVHENWKTEKERAARLEARLAELESAKEDTWANKNEPDPDDDEPLTKGELKKTLEQERAIAAENRAREILDEQMKQYEKEIDGKDGRPAFRESEIREYVRLHPEDAHRDPKRVYEAKYREELALWRANQIIKKQKESENLPTGGKKPSGPGKDTSKMTEKEYDDYVRQKYGGK